MAREIVVMNTFVVTVGRYLRTNIRRQYPGHLEAVIIFGGENRAAPRRAVQCRVSAVAPGSEVSLAKLPRYAVARGATAIISPPKHFH